MQGRHPKNKIVLKDEDRKNLEKIAKSRTAEIRLVQRAQIILLAAEGKYRNTGIGEKVGCNRITVRKWRRRFQESGMDGLKDMPRSGHPLEFTAQEQAEVLVMATRKPEDE
jgi:transposase